MPAPARRPDFQTDYEDPVDRLHRPKGVRAKKDQPPKKPNPAANVSYYLGMIGLVPCVGLLFGPLALLAGGIGLSKARDPQVGGKGRARSGVWFGLVAVVINYVVPLGLFIWLRTIR